MCLVLWSDKGERMLRREDDADMHELLDWLRKDYVILEYI